MAEDYTEKMLKIKKSLVKLQPMIDQHGCNIKDVFANSSDECVNLIVNLAIDISNGDKTIQDIAYLEQFGELFGRLMIRGIYSIFEEVER